jgi:hypothetical protein
VTPQPDAPRRLQDTTSLHKSIPLSMVKSQELAIQNEQNQRDTKTTRGHSFVPGKPNLGAVNVLSAHSFHGLCTPSPSACLRLTQLRHERSLQTSHQTGLPNSLPSNLNLGLAPWSHHCKVAPLSLETKKQKLMPKDWKSDKQETDTLTGALQPRSVKPTNLE